MSRHRNDKKPSQVNQYTTLAALTGLLLLATLLYLPPYIDAFVGDDYVQLWRVRELLETPGQAWRVFGPTWTDWYYRPLQNLWFLANRLIFGLQPAAYYYQLAGLHLIVTALLYHLARQLGLARPAALLAAALFALNGQHQITVSWNSNLAIILGAALSLSAAVSFLNYLHCRRPRWLAATLTFSLLTLLAHEEGFLLPLFLAGLWFTNDLKSQETKNRPLFLAAALMALATLGYLVLQLSRPNANVNLSSDPGQGLAAILDPAGAGRFLLQSLGRWLGLAHTNWGLALQENLPGEGLALLILPLGLAGLGYWLWHSRRAGRLGLYWAALHLGFIYAALWSQQPDFFSGRHLYNAWLGLSLALGAGLIGRRPVAMRRLTAAALLSGLFLLLQIGRIQAGQQALAAQVEEVRQVEQQLKEMLPQVSAATHLYASSFILSAPYFAPTAAVWYDQPSLEGGSLRTFLQRESLSPNDYLFAQSDGRLYNLMPELQQYEQTTLLWARAPLIVRYLDQEGRLQESEPEPLSREFIADVAGRPMPALPVQTRDDSWSSLKFSPQIPAGGQLAFAVWGAGLDFRVRLHDQLGREHLLWETTIPTSATPGWQEQLISLAPYAGQVVTLRLELRGRNGAVLGYWGNVRLVR